MARFKSRVAVSDRIICKGAGKVDNYIYIKNRRLTQMTPPKI